MKDLRELMNTIEKAKEKVLIGEKYKHYKGGVYTILDIVLFEHDADAMVIYQDAVHPDLKWGRKLSEFLEKIEDSPRFEHVNEGRA